jgi:hypothetical protein
VSSVPVITSTPPMGHLRQYFVDLTSTRWKRDCMGLVKVSHTLANVVIIASTDPGLAACESGAGAVGPAAQHMLTELLHGCVDCTTPSGEQVRVRAGVMTVQLEPSPLSPPAPSSSPSASITLPLPSQSGLLEMEKSRAISLLSEHDKIGLDACHLVQVQFMSGERPQSPPPLFIQLAHGEKNHASPLEYLLLKETNLSTIVMCGNVLSLSNLSYFENILSQYPKFLLLVDCFGSVEKPISDRNGEWNHFPCDDEVCHVVQCLVSKGHVARLILSCSVTSKLKLSNYGGAGYNHIEQSVIPRLLRHNISSEHIHRLTVTNLTTLVTWYVPPPEIAPEKETFRCYICDKESTFGEHYEKFEFLYCTSICLREHAKRKWAK